MPENAPAKTSGQGVALRQGCGITQCSAYRLEASSQGSASSLGGVVLLGSLQGWDKGAREEHVLLGLELWIPGGLMPFSGLEIVLLTGVVPGPEGHRQVRCLKQPEPTWPGWGIKIIPQPSSTIRME